MSKTRRTHEPECTAFTFLTRVCQRDLSTTGVSDSSQRLFPSTRENEPDMTGRDKKGDVTGREKTNQRDTRRDVTWHDMTWHDRTGQEVDSCRRQESATVVNDCCHWSESTTVGNDNEPVTHVNDSSQWHGSTARVSDKSHRLVSGCCQPLVSKGRCQLQESMTGVDSKGQQPLCQRREKTNQRDTTRVNDAGQRLLSTTSSQRHEVTWHDMTWHDAPRRDFRRDARRRTIVTRHICDSCDCCQRQGSTTAVNDVRRRTNVTRQEWTTLVTTTHVNDSCQRLLSTTWGGVNMRWRDTTWLSQLESLWNPIEFSYKSLLKREFAIKFLLKRSLASRFFTWLLKREFAIRSSLISYWNANSQSTSL